MRKFEWDGVSHLWFSFLRLSGRAGFRERLFGQKRQAKQPSGIRNCLFACRIMPDFFEVKEIPGSPPLLTCGLMHVLSFFDDLSHCIDGVK